MSESYTQAEFLRDYDAALRGYTVTGYESHPGYNEPTFVHMMKPLT